jgi:hypothetical protein
MKTNVQPGMLAIVIPPNGMPMSTPEMIGRVVYVEGLAGKGVVRRDESGILLRIEDTPSVVWIISASEPLPTRVIYPDGRSNIHYLAKRAMRDTHLRPILDPNIDVSDEEVKELYSTKEKECQVSQ